MFKLVFVLAAGMFVTLLIGGEDNGQVRQGLVGVEPATEALVQPAAAVPAAVPAAEALPAQNAAVKLITFTPMAVQTPKPAQPAPIVGAFVLEGVDETKLVEAAPTPVAAPDALPVLYVISNSVNVRGGPSTNFEVVGRLTRAEAVTVVSPAEDGWVQIRIEGDGVEGFIAARLLTDIAPAN
jgi:uncharacterized protein YgiM (DUF1202 family)